MKSMMGMSVAMAVAALTAGATCAAMDLVPAGVRAMGMGGAFTAVADDPTAVYWNPAGLFLLREWDASWEGYLSTETIDGAEAALHDLLANPPVDQSVYTDPDRAAAAANALKSLRECGLLARQEETMLWALTGPKFGLSLGQWSRTFILPGAIDLDHIAAGEPGGEASLADNSSLLRRLDLERTEYAISSELSGAGGQFVLGLTARYQRWTASEEWRAPWDFAADIAADELVDDMKQGESVKTGTWTIDVGLLAFMGNGRIGITARDLRQPVIDLPSGEELEIERSYRAGYAFIPSPSLTIALDYDIGDQKIDGETWNSRQIAFGFEKWFGESRGLAIRAGGRRDLAWDSSPMVLTAGTTLDFGRFLLEGAAEMDLDDLRTAYTFGLGISLN